MPRRRGRTVAAQVLVDVDGVPQDFWTDDRCATLPDGLVRARWHPPVSGWHVEDGPPRLVRARAVWELASGPVGYAEFDLDVVVTDPEPWRSG